MKNKKIVKQYHLFVVPCNEQTEFISHKFETSCVDNDSIYILTKKKIQGAVQISFNDSRIGSFARQWLKECLLDIELKALSDDTAARRNMRKFIDVFEKELEQQYEKYMGETPNQKEG